MRTHRRQQTLALAVFLLGLPLAAHAQLRNMAPVTDAMIQNPDPSDWLNL